MRPMANIITLFRFFLLFGLVALTVKASPTWQLAAPPLLVLIIALDGIDGYVARLRGESSNFGAMFDIIVDRVVENVLWIVLTYLGQAPLWVTLLFITRGIVVDSIRQAAVKRGETPFGMMRSRLGRFLVAGRFMRGFYGAAKAVTFAWLLLLVPLPQTAPAFWQDWQGAMTLAGAVLTYLSVILCLLRGAPVIVESLAAEGVMPRRWAFHDEAK